MRITKRRPAPVPTGAGGINNHFPRPTHDNGSGDGYIVSDSVPYDNLRVAQAAAMLLALALGELAREWESDGNGSEVQAAQRLARAALALADDVRALAAQSGGQP